MAKSNNEDDGGWDKLEREFCKVKNNVATPANGSKPLSASEQAKLIDKFASEIRSLWYRSVKAILVIATACAEADRQLGPKQRKILVEKRRSGSRRSASWCRLARTCISATLLSRCLRVIRRSTS